MLDTEILVNYSNCWLITLKALTWCHCHPPQWKKPSGGGWGGRSWGMTGTLGWREGVEREGLRQGLTWQGGQAPSTELYRGVQKGPGESAQTWDLRDTSRRSGRCHLVSSFTRGRARAKSWLLAACLDKLALRARVHTSHKGLENPSTKIVDLLARQILRRPRPNKPKCCQHRLTLGLKMFTGRFRNWTGRGSSCAWLGDPSKR